MKYGTNTNEIEALIKSAVRESLKETLRELGLGQGENSMFPLRSCKEVAKVFNVSDHTVKDWHRKGVLRGHYQVLSGRACRLIFTNRDLLRFFDENFPALEDLGDHPCSPRPGSKASRLIEKMFAMNRLYARRRQRVITEEKADGR